MRHTRAYDDPRRLDPLGNTFFDVDGDEEDEGDETAISLLPTPPAEEASITPVARRNRRSHSFAGYVPNVLRGLREAAARQPWAAAAKEAQTRRAELLEHHSAGICREPPPKLAPEMQASALPTDGTLCPCHGPVLLGRLNSFCGGRHAVCNSAMGDDDCRPSPTAKAVVCPPWGADTDEAQTRRAVLPDHHKADIWAPKPAPEMQVAIKRERRPLKPGLVIHQPPVLLNSAAMAPGAATQSATPQAVASALRLQESSKATSEKITTMMVRDLPKEVTQSMLLAELDESGYKGSYDYCYMPRVFATGQNQGFAFVNFTSPKIAAKFCSAWDRRRQLGTCFMTKSLSVYPAAIQGLKANLVKWKTARMRRVGNPEFKPFVDFGGKSTESNCAGISNTEDLQAPLKLTLELDKMVNARPATTATLPA